MILKRFEGLDAWRAWRANGAFQAFPASSFPSLNKFWRKQK